jgi:hypothetical protein
MKFITAFIYCKPALALAVQDFPHKILETNFLSKSEIAKYAYLSITITIEYH